MQAYVPAWRNRQSDPTPGFHFLKSSVEMGPLKKAMPSQLSPGLTLTNLLQLPTMPVWMGEGVVMPLPGLVGVPPTTPTQAYVPACSVRQSTPRVKVLSDVLRNTLPRVFRDDRRRRRLCFRGLSVLQLIGKRPSNGRRVRQKPGRYAGSGQEDSDRA